MLRRSPVTIRRAVATACVLLLSATGCGQGAGTRQTDRDSRQAETEPAAPPDFYSALADSAATLVWQQVTYDPAYRKIPYPGGDVPADKGVCTDVVIRAYRKMGIDLQKRVHEDMKANFSLYPKKWGMKGTDTNIDHRRVPNLMVFFAREGTELPITTDAKDYSPGDIVCWDLREGVTHIGIVVAQQNRARTRYKVVHNIGAGQTTDDILFDFKIIGHYRYEK